MQSVVFLMRAAHFYTKNSYVSVPFSNAKYSILTLFDPIIIRTQGGNLETVDWALVKWAFVKCHGIFYTGKNAETLDDTRNKFFPTST